MADRRQVHHWWRVIRQIKVWQLLVLIIIGGVISVELLRQNNLGMLGRRNEVKMADEQGDEAKIQTALKNLQNYISSHMNTSMGDNGVYLEHAYQRAYEKAVQDGLKNDTSSHSLYDQADAACQAVFNKTYSFPAYTQCVAGKLSGQAAADDPLTKIQTPLVDLYRYNYVSPLWTPDLAGMTLLITVLVAFLLVTRLLLALILQLLLRSRLSWL